jgi:hypothetical protein
MPHVDYFMTTPQQKQLVPPLTPSAGEVLNGRWLVRSTLPGADVWLAVDNAMGNRGAVLVVARRTTPALASAFWLQQSACGSGVLIDTFAFGDDAVGALVFPSPTQAGPPPATLSRETRARALLSAASNLATSLSRSESPEVLPLTHPLLTEHADGMPELVVLTRPSTQGLPFERRVAEARAWLQRVGANWIWGENSQEDGVSEKWTQAWLHWETCVAERKGDPAAELSSLLAVPAARKVAVPTAIVDTSAEPGAAYNQKAADLRTSRNRQRVILSLTGAAVAATVLLIRFFGGS